ncbi:hypothetical protein SNE40_019230 [Patella caerulea]|uniref:Cytochrome P450 n=1 Tax=Patella caerulea TaxID=87958 RepID=A0AAN8P5H8_PATCE
MIEVLNHLKSFFQNNFWEDLCRYCPTNLRIGLVCGVCIGIWWLMRKPHGIPPGPRFTLPIVGDLLFLEKESQPVMLRNMRDKYGDIFSIYMGSSLFIVLNGYDVIKEALVKYGHIFSDKPHMFMYDLISDKKGIVFTSGQLWKEQRKFALETLREFGFGKTILEDKVHEEIGYYIEVVDTHNGRPFDMCRLTQAAASNIISSLVYGNRFDYDNLVFKEYLNGVDEMFEDLGSTAVLNFLPVLRFMPGDLFKYKRTLKNLWGVENTIIKPSIQEHLENYDENNTNDYISSYIKEMKRVQKEGQTSYINEDNLVKSIGDLFVAGTETTSTAILWTILYLLHHPNIQDRCYKEIQDVVGSGRLPSMKDKTSMPYNEAVLLEVLRKANVVTIGTPHSLNQDTVFRGYNIPKHAIILPNLDSVLADNKIWGDADVFRPERFLDNDGKVTKPDEFIPFSLGRRICLGESLAKMELFLFMTTMIQRFEFKPVDPDNLPKLEGVIGITNSPCKYEVRAVPR